MSYASRNNGKITNRPSGGGSSKGGLAPTATHFYIASSTGKNYYIRGRNSLVNNSNCIDAKKILDFTNNLQTDNSPNDKLSNVLNDTNCPKNLYLISRPPAEIIYSSDDLYIGLEGLNGKYRFYFPIIATDKTNRYYYNNNNVNNNLGNYRDIIKDFNFMVFQYINNNNDLYYSIYKIIDQRKQNTNYVVDIEYVKSCNSKGQLTVDGSTETFETKTDYLEEYVISNLDSINNWQNSNVNSNVSYSFLFINNN